MKEYEYAFLNLQFGNKNRTDIKRNTCISLYERTGREMNGTTLLKNLMILIERKNISMV